MAFDESIMKLGTLKFGEVKDFTVEFTNTGKNDFEIFHLQGGCICTEPIDWSKGKVKPGQKGFITFKFDTNKASVQKAYNSSLEIVGNIKDDMMIYEIEADIVE